jgi:hypothetical protein
VLEFFVQLQRFREESRRFMSSLLVVVDFLFSHGRKLDVAFVEDGLPNSIFK